MSDSLLQIGTQILRAILPVIIIVGVVGNLFNIAVLTRPALYNHSCSRYFLALASNNLFYSSIFFTYRLLATGYQIDPSNYSIISCKIINYIYILSSFLSPYLIVCASIDRYCASSTSAQIRKFSHIRVTKWMIFIVVTVFSLIFINVLVLADLHQERGFTCAIQANTIYSQVYIIIQVFLFAAVPPSLMALFGFMTIQNSHRSRVVPVAASRYNRTEHQLARMLFLQVSAYILLTLPSSIIYLMSALPNTIRTTLIFSFASTICQLFFNCSYVMPFFLYLLSGHIYRKELIRLIYTKLRIRCGDPVEPSIDQNIVVPVILSVYPQSTV